MSEIKKRELIGIRTLSDEKIELMVSNVKTSLAIEGLYVTEGESKIYRRYLKGDMTEGEVLTLFLDTPSH